MMLMMMWLGVDPSLPIMPLCTVNLLSSWDNIALLLSIMSMWFLRTVYRTIPLLDFIAGGFMTSTGWAS